MLEVFKKQGPTNFLSLQDLTMKTAMLFTLTRPCQGADLAELDVNNNRSFVPKGVKFTPVHLSIQLDLHITVSTFSSPHSRGKSAFVQWQH